MSDVRLVAEPFDPAAELAAFTADLPPSVGGVAAFVGLCRADDGVLALELEAYPGFTEAAVEAERARVQGLHGLHALQCVHRVGRVRPGEAIVWVAAAAPHRRAAFEGCDRMMDVLKSRAPFWKREHTAAGARWIEPRPQDYDDAARWDAPPPAEV